MSGKCPSIDSVDVVEAYSLAITIEEAGVQFYQKLIDNSDSEQAKNELTYLKEQEMKHKEIFKNLLKEIGGEEMKDETSDLHCWVDDNLIKPMAEAVEKHLPGSSHEALRVGARMEEQVIELFYELKNAAETKEAAKAIKNIIKEEKKHKKLVNIILAY